MSILLNLPFSLSIMSLRNPNYSQGFNSILKSLKSFSFKLSTYINMFKTELTILSFISPTTDFLFPISENGTTTYQVAKARTLGVVFDSSEFRTYV